MTNYGPPPGQDPYGQPPGYGPPPPGYGGYPPPYGFAPQGQEHPDGNTVLILGLLGILLCSILGPIAWVKGKAALREIDSQPGRYTNRSNVMVGYVCGIIATVLMIIGLVAVVAIIGIAASVESTN